MGGRVVTCIVWLEGWNGGGGRAWGELFSTNRLAAPPPFRQQPRVSCLACRLLRRRPQRTPGVKTPDAGPEARLLAREVLLVGVLAELHLILDGPDGHPPNR